MPTSFSFTEEVIATGNQLNPQWRKVFVAAVTSGAGKKDKDSTTWTVNLVVAEGEDGAKTPITVWFSSNFMQAALNYVKAFIPAGEKIIPGKEYPIEATSGNFIVAYCCWDVDNQRNIVKDWRPVPVA